MRREDVPQHRGLNNGCKEVNYAVDAAGHYTLEQSVGWEAKTVALEQAWQAIDEQLREVIAAINAGEKSSLAYHMVKNQMDPALLAQYSGISRWQVKRHLKPRIFNKLSESSLVPYLDVFDVTVEQLRTIPVQPDILPTDQGRLDSTGEN